MMRICCLLTCEFHADFIVIRPGGSGIFHDEKAKMDEVSIPSIYKGLRNANRALKRLEKHGYSTDEELDAAMDRVERLVVRMANARARTLADLTLKATAAKPIAERVRCQEPTIPELDMVVSVFADIRRLTAGLPDT